MALRTSDIDTNDKPWNSINSMLMQNKCWLCCNTFAKGKQKTVFQVSWLLQFFCAKFEFDQNTTAFLNQNLELYSGAATEEDFDLLKTTLHSVNLKTCYERYKVLRSSSKTSDGNESIAALEKDLADNDVALWMSGLLCGVTPQCISEMRIFVPGFRNARVPFFLAEQPQSKNTLPSQSDKNCLPGCGCDNPWAFISAAYKK